TVMDDYETLISTTDVELLKKAWRNEKGAPEILQFEDALVKRIQEQIQLMEENVEEFTHISIDPLTVSLYHMDLNITQFLLRSYLRIRLLKVDIIYYSTSLVLDSIFGRIYKQNFNCTDAMDIHLQSSVLTKLPENYQSILKQSLMSEEDDMGTQIIFATFLILF
ncbi:LOW QUALITY PROTEIN: hypothetical protein CFOL_v3_15191, partial [Cephalotus follicularis]